MRKFHQNIFYYYKGQSARPRLMEKQLENNTTKALINTIEYSGINTQKKILEDLVGIKLSKKIKKISFTLQEESLPEGILSEIKKKIILVITPKGKPIKPDPDGESKIPDAWIWCEDFAILLEVKTKNEITPFQLGGYRKYMGNNCFIIFKSWKTHIHPLFHKLLTNNSKKDGLIEVEKLLFEQFRNYLEMIDMSTFVGYSLEDFRWKWSDDKDEKKFVRNKLKSLTEYLSEDIKERGLYKVNFKHDWHSFSTRQNINKSKGKTRYYNILHYTYGLHSSYFFIKLHFQYSSPSFKKFKKIIKADENEEEKFIDLLSELEKENMENYQIMLHRGDTIHIFEPQEWDDSDIDMLIRLLKETEVLWFTIENHIYPGELEKLGINIGDTIIDTIDELKDIFDYFSEF